MADRKTLHHSFIYTSQYMYLTPYAPQAIIRAAILLTSKICMARKHKEVLAQLPGGNLTAPGSATTLTTLKGLRKRAGQTQEELAAALGVGQDTISRLEKRSDMLLSTLRHYVECIGGQLTLVATFPNQPPTIIDYGDAPHPEPKKRGRKPVGLEAP